MTLAQYTMLILLSVAVQRNAALHMEAHMDSTTAKDEPFVYVAEVLGVCLFLFTSALGVENVPLTCMPVNSLFV